MWKRDDGGHLVDDGGHLVDDGGRWNYVPGDGGINRSYEHSHHEEKHIMSEGSSPLGLTLKKTPSLVNLIEDALCHTNRKKNIDDFTSPVPIFEKLKASNFAAYSLRIGDWEVVSKHDGNLVAKCYFAKRKLVWEILEGPLKKKIELQWSNIVGIRATILENHPSILEIELNEPPLFFREMDPQPRKHTLWQPSTDFTGGQASKCRRHYVRFPAGALDKSYENILLCDPRLKGLSRGPFPSEKSPYFDPGLNGLSQFFENEYGSRHHLQRLECQYQNYPPTFGQPHLQKLNIGNDQNYANLDDDSPMSVMTFNHGNDQTSYTSTRFGNELWDQEHDGENEVVLQGLPNHEFNVYAGDAKELIRLREIENHFLGEGESEMSCNQQLLFSMGGPFLEPLEEFNINSNTCVENAQENIVLAGNVVSPGHSSEQQQPQTIWRSPNGYVGGSPMVECPPQNQPLQSVFYLPNQDFIEAESGYYEDVRHWTTITNEVPTTEWNNIH